MTGGRFGDDCLARRGRGLFCLAVAAAAFACPKVALSIELGAPDDLLSVEIHGFASEGFILTSSNNYLANATTQGSFQFSELGLNFTKSLTDELRLGLQLFAQDLGPTGNYNVTLDWFYVDYRYKDWLGLRVGRVKIPFGLYNEINDVDAARVPVLLPQSVYPIQNVNYLLAQTGGELYGYLRLSGAGALDYHAYVGTIFVDTATSTTTNSPYQIGAFYVPYVAGGRILWETPLEGLRVGGSVQALKLVTTITAGPNSATVSIPAVLWVASAEYAHKDLLLSAEYSQWAVAEDSSNPTLIPQTPYVTSQRGYVMASYREACWLDTGAYFSMLFPNADALGGRQTRQNDLALTVRFDINAFWLVKLEGHYMFGTAGLDSTLNGGTPLSALTEQWGVFLLKTTAYF